MAEDDPTLEPAPEEPAPVIERIRTWVFELSALQAVGGPALMCPRCGEPTLEYLGVTTFDREPDGRSTSFTRVQDTITTQHRLPQAQPGDSRYRWHGVDVEFGCNSCASVYDTQSNPTYSGLGHGIFLEIIDTRGACSMSWVYDPLPEGYGG